jgi:carbon storage regulator
MLILSRKPNETIIIDDRITITVTKMSSERVCIGVSAPKEMSIHRGEVWNAIHNGMPPKLPEDCT